MYFVENGCIDCFELLMNLFLVPDEVCDSIEVLMNEYWWGHGQRNKALSGKLGGKCV